MKAPLAALAIGAMLATTGCATVEPEPCTAEWIDYKKDRILRSFAVDNRRLINDLRKLADADGQVSPFMAMRLLQNTDRIERFIETFQDDVIPDLEQAFNDCSQSENLVPALTEFLADEGVSPAALERISPFIEAAMEYRRNQQLNDDTL